MKSLEDKIVNLEMKLEASCASLKQKVVNTAKDQTIDIKSSVAKIDERIVSSVQQIQRYQHTMVTSLQRTFIIKLVTSLEAIKK